MLTSQQRYQSIQGLLMGMAIGDALAHPKLGQPSSRVLGRIGKFRALRYRTCLGGVYSHQTQFALLLGQAILQSRSTSEGFHETVCRRLKWYVLSLAPGMPTSTFIAGLRCWVRWLGVSPSVQKSAGSPPAFAALLGVVLHNTGHRYQSWARETATLVHNHPLVIDCASLMATVGQIAAVTSSGKINKVAALELLIKASRETELKDILVQLEPMLEARLSPRKAAAKLGWSQGISKQAVPSTIMAIYCFLRYPSNFEHAVKSALLISEHNEALTAMVGCLVGTHVGVDRLPEHLQRTLRDWPHTRQWIERLATRLSDWPHGVDDLLVAPAQPSYAPFQLMRNVMRWPYLVFNRLLSLAGYI